MRFLRKKEIEKVILVISDIHLGAGAYVNGKKNFLEDFHYDKELVEFMEYFSTGEYVQKEVELIINGDLFDLLAVPFVPYFDDEYWSEKASLEKLKMILKAHSEVMDAFSQFLKVKNKKIVFIIGNHDGEFVFESLQKLLIDHLDEDVRDKFIIKLNSDGEYSPVEGVVLMHGHEYELAHKFDPQKSIIEDKDGQKYFIPPWGSYYVTRVINKFKEQRNHINAVKPIPQFIVNGLIYDPLYTIRFTFANMFYFFMVRFIQFFKQSNNFSDTLKRAGDELELFQDYESYAEDFFEKRPEARALIVGHTHEPRIRHFVDGKTFINTGTWTDMYYLDFEMRDRGSQLPFAQVNVLNSEDNNTDVDINLHVWKGTNTLPFEDF